MTRPLRKLVPWLAGLALLAACSGPPRSSESRAPLLPPADLLFLGGTVRTAEPGAEPASALAVVGGSIAWVGDERDAGRWRGSRTQVVDLAGRTLLPGLGDAHLHLAGYANQLAELDLTGTGSYQEVVAAVLERAAALPPGTWIVGRGWDQNDWPVQEFPNHALLSQAVPGHPVVLRRIDGHALLANAAALAAAGVDVTSRAPEGGRILREADGAPTGVLIDDAMQLVDASVPEVDPGLLAERVQAAIASLHRYGITAIHDAGVDAETLAVYEALDRAGRFRLRNHVMVSADEPRLHLGRAVSGWPIADLTGSGHIGVRAIKLSADGALGSRGAALLADYSDDAGNRGLVTATEEQILALARFALAEDFQLCTHAIGDAANRAVLDAYETAIREDPEAAQDARFRIEHAQVLDPADIPRFADLGVVPSMQAQHQTSDMPWAEARLGPERVRGAYAWRALLDTGCRIPGGSDCPVEQPDPIAAFHAAVTRQDEQLQPPGGWYPEQRMTRTEALASLTRWTAWAAFRENELGTLTPGKRADLVVLSGDPLVLPDDELPGIAVELTVFDGEVVWSRTRTAGAP